MKIRIAVATRMNQNDFMAKSAIGKSLAFNLPPHIDLRVFVNNTRGLAAVYNEVIKSSAADPATLVFAHDDLHILDFYWTWRILEGLKHFQILGMAGNVRRVPNQPSWAFVDDRFTWDQRENLSGIVGHGRGFPPENLSVFGSPRKKVKLLDGLMLACESQTLIENGLFFDERFDFHFYDMDFCRQAESKGISCGTWDVSLIHESGGSFGSDAWRSSYKTYLDKWGD